MHPMAINGACTRVKVSKQKVAIRMLKKAIDSNGGRMK